MKSIRLAALAVPLVMLATPSSAGVIPYRLTITVDSAGVGGCEERLAFNLSVRPDAHNFGCNWHQGDQIVGTFSLFDDPAGLVDGVHRLPLSSLSISIGSVVFDSSMPSDLEVIRGAFGVVCPSSPDPAADTAYPPVWSARLITTGGEVTGFCEALRHAGGNPWINLFEVEPYAGVPHWFQASDFFSGVLLTGSYAVERIPEPASLPLAGAALVAAAWLRRPSLRRPADGRCRCS